MLNFKDWQKVGEDKKTVTLKHPKGHMITIAMSGLPKIQREAIKRLKFADGETVPENDQPAAPAPNVSLQQAAAAPISIPTPQPTQPILGPDGSTNPVGAAQNVQAGINLDQGVAAEKAKADAVYQDQFLKERQRLNNLDAQHIQELQGHTNDFANYMKANPINENAYLENKSAGSKMATALGMVLSGAGSGVTGQPSMAMDFLNRQIDRNIDAQKARADQQKTIWGAYHDLYGDQNIATDLAKHSANDMLVHQADLTAAQLGTPTAQAAAMALRAQKGSENQKLLMDSAGRLSSLPNYRGSQPVAPPPAATGTAPTSSPQAAPQEPPQASTQPKGWLQNQIDEANGIQAKIFGPNQSQASTEKEEPLEPDNYADTPLLKPNAQIWEAAPQDIKSQFAQADQADKVLSQLHSVHQQLAKDTTHPDYSYFRRHNPLSGVPFVGDAFSHAWLQPKTDNATNRDFESNRTRIVSDVANAVGPNVSGEEIQRMVNDNLPEVHDSPRTIAQKERNIRIFIKNHVPTTMLKAWKQSER